jgi:hypothetical protein
MPEETSQWVNAVAKLTELTQQGKLNWRSIIAEESNLAGPVFVTTYKEKKLRLKQVWQLDLQGFIREKRRVVRLEFVDAADAALWAFPENPALDDLYRAARFQAAGVQEFLTDILKD